MNDEFMKKMSTMYNSAKSTAKTDTKARKNKLSKSTPFTVTRAYPDKDPKATAIKSNKLTKNTPTKTTKTEVKNKNVTSNNKSGHVLLTPVMIDVHQVAQLDALKQTLGLKNRAQATALVMNKRQTIADIINNFSKKNPAAKKDYKIHYESFLISHKPKVIRNYRKYHSSKK